MLLLKKRENWILEIKRGDVFLESNPAPISLSKSLELHAWWKSDYIFLSTPHSKYKHA